MSEIVKDFFEACNNGDVEFVKNMNFKSKMMLEIGMRRACKHGKLEMVKLMMEKGANDWNWGMYYACQGGQMDTIKFMIEKGANNWEKGMQFACKGGKIDIVNFMIEKGANNFNLGMNYACRGGQLEIMKYMIVCTNIHGERENKNKWNKAMTYAISGKNIEIVKLICSYQNEFNWIELLRCAFVCCRLNIVKFFIEKVRQSSLIGRTNCKRKLIMIRVSFYHSLSMKELSICLHLSIFPKETIFWMKKRLFFLRMNRVTKLSENLFPVLSRYVLK